MKDTIIETITLNTSNPINIVFVGMMGKGRGYTLCAGHLEQAIIEYVERSFDIKSVKNKIIEEKWVEITTKPNDWCFYTVEEPIISIWYEQGVNSHRFKIIDGKRYYNINVGDNDTNLP